MKKPSVIAIALMIILAVSGCGSVQQTAAEPGHAGLLQVLLILQSLPL